MYGLGAFISIRIIGILSVSEILAIACSPFLFLTVYNENKSFRRISFLFALWLFGSVVSDFFNETEYIVFLKGSFSIVIFYINFIFCFWIINKQLDSLDSFLWGLAFSFLFGTIFGFNVFYQEYIENQNISSIVEDSHFNKLLVAILMYFIWAISSTYFRRFPVMVLIIVFIFSIYSLVNGSRSTFLIHFISIFYCIYISLLISKFSLPLPEVFKYLNKRKLIFFIVFIVSLIFSRIIYSNLAEQGYMGEDEYLKYNYQKNLKLGLLSGRSEIFSSFIAIIDSPILGHGSYAKDLKGFNIKAAELSGEISNLFIYTFDQDSYIRTHSHIFGSWVNNGILSLFLWLFLITISIKFLFKYSFFIYKYFFILSISVFSILWKVLFSPFSERVYLAFMFSFFLIIMQMIKYNDK